MVNELKEYGIVPVISDSVADVVEAKRIYGTEFVDMSSIADMDAVIFTVAHDEFKKISKADMDGLYSPAQCEWDS